MKKKKKNKFKENRKEYHNISDVFICGNSYIVNMHTCSPEKKIDLEKANKQINSNQTHNFKFLLSEIVIAICTALCFCLSETSVLVSFGEVDRMNSHSVKP